MHFAAAIEHGHVHAPVHDQLAEGDTVVFVEVQHDPGVALTHCTQQGQGQRRGRRTGRQAHRHLPGQGLPAGVDIVLRLLALAQDQLRVAVQHLARSGRRDPALGADQQLLLHLGFEGRQLLAQGGLSDMQHIGGLGHAADIHQLHEVFQTTQIHDGDALV